MLDMHGYRSGVDEAVINIHDHKLVEDMMHETLEYRWGVD